MEGSESTDTGEVFENMHDMPCAGGKKPAVSQADSGDPIRGTENGLEIGSGAGKSTVYAFICEYVH